MHKVLAATLMALAATAALAQGGTGLFHLSAKRIQVENGKVLNMTLREIERRADSSTIDVSFVSGGSVSGSMFVLRGMCGVARARGEKYFHATQIARQPARYRVTFPQSVEPADSNLEGKVFSLSECALLQY